MTATQHDPASVSAARGECVACCRPYGRRRAPRIDAGTGGGDALLACAELVVCDQCWHLAGGARAVQAKLVDPTGENNTGGGGGVQPLLVLDPAVEELLAGADDYDLLHPIDRLLVESGVRWVVLRHIAVPARMELARWVLERAAPERTRSAISAEVWLVEVEQRIRAQTRVQAPAGAGGGEFVYRGKQRRWWRIANVLRRCCDRDGRPLTWVTQDEIAAAVGCSTRTVRRCVAWLQAEGLLWEVLPGCRLPLQAVPDGETPAEKTERRRRAAESLAAAIAAENAAMARARAELDAVRGSAPTSTATGQQILPLPAPGLLNQDEPVDDELNVAPQTGPETAVQDVVQDVAVDAEAQLVNLAPVYELRVPVPEIEAAETNTLTRAHTPTPTPGQALARRHAADLVHPTNAHLYPTLVAISPDGQLTPLPTPAALNALNSGNAVGLLRDTQNVHPPMVYNCDQLKSSPVQPVDNRRAPRDPEHRGSEHRKASEIGPGCAAAARTCQPEGQPSRTPQSEAVRAAQWLLRSRLDPRVCEDVSIRWLAAGIRGSTLLHHQWTWQDLADQLHGYPEYTHLPRNIHNCRRWIRARLTRANPALPPSKLRIILNIERRSPLMRERHRQEREQARQAEITARRAAIAACDLCDELGWLHLAHDVPTARCTHDPATGGW